MIPGYEAKIIADSVSEAGKRIISVQVRSPLIVHNEFMTHRVFSRGSASSRAIPVAKMIQSVMEDPFIPDKWYHNQKGMQPGEEITREYDVRCCILSWLRSRDAAVAEVQYLSRECDVAKEIANRLIGPFFWNTIIITSTQWCNFFNLRCHPMAQRQIRIAAEMIRDAVFESQPTLVKTGGAHAPYITDEDYADVWGGNFPVDVRRGYELLAELSTGRCARVSYVNQEGVRDRLSDIALHNRLVAQVPKHSGPLEHFASALDNPYEWSGNFQGWKQYRKTVADENLLTYTHNGRTITDRPTRSGPGNG